MGHRLSRRWTDGSAEESLRLSDEDAALVEMRVRLVEKVRERRRAKRLTQRELAERMGSTEARVAKLEQAGASIETPMRALLALGVGRKEIARLLDGAMPLGERFTRAFKYCFQLHGAQTRKGKSTPYVAHLMAVGALVVEDGGDEDEAIAALLHDALEDQPEKASRKEIARRFGERVLELVTACSDTPRGYKGGKKPPWRRRKEGYLAHVREGASGALRIALADKLHNAREILADYRDEGERLWSRFNASKADQLWFQRSLVEAFRKDGATGFMIEELERVVSELERLAGRS